jgi:hypothetical protein
MDGTTTTTPPGTPGGIVYPTMDFMVSYDATSGKLTYSEWKWDATLGELRRQPVEADFYDWGNNGSSYRYLVFTLTNQKLTVSMAKDKSGAPDTADELVAADKTKPVGYATYALFPAAALNALSTNVVVQSFNRVKDYDDAAITDPATDTQHGQSDRAAGIDLSSHPGLAKKGTKSADSAALDSYTVLISAQSPDYDADGNCAEELGYIEDPVDEGEETSSKLTTFESEDIPDMISTDVLHIRVSALDVRSYNGVKSGISKILYTLPRFSETGSAYGRLHITPHEKTYLALNNTNTLHLNDIHVEFVNSDETLAKDLTDNAHVIFHIRPGAGKCGCGEHSKH